MKNLKYGVAVLPILLCGLSYAQDVVEASSDTVAEDQVATMDAVIVTAQFRSQSLQDIPIAVTALSDEQLQNQRITNALDLSNLAPGLRIASGDAAANPKIFIRGVGLADFNPSSSAGVSMYVDHVLYGSPLSQMSGFFDLERIEVLRGPQGTLYGRNTTGGALNIVSKDPTDEFTMDASVDYGSYNRLNANVGFGGPIIEDKLSYRFAAMALTDEGYTENRATGNDVNESDRWAVRGKLLFTPTADLEIKGMVSFFQNRGSARQIKHRALFPGTAEATDPTTGYCAPGYFNSGLCTDVLGYADTSSDPYSIESNLEGEDQVDVVTSSLEVVYHMDSMDFISITAYQASDRDDIENTDANPLQMIEARYRAQQSQFTQEFRLQSSDDKALSWVLGGYYLNDDLQDNSSYDILRILRPMYMSPENPLGISPADSVGLFGWPYTQKTESWAVFGQADYDVTDKLTATVGLRWSSDKKEMDYVSQVEDGLITLLTFRDDETFSDWSGRLGLSYQYTPNTNFYAMYNRGYKSGGYFGGQATSADQLEPYDNETLNAFEVGSKNDLFGWARLNLAAFYYDYQDQQVFAQVLRNGVTTQVLDNAASSTIYGLEAEFSAQLTEGLNVGLNGSWLESEIEEFESEGEDYSGNPLQHAPEFSLSGTVNYEFNLANGSQLFTDWDANYRSKVYFNNTKTERLSEEGKTIVNGQIGWRSADGILETGLFVKNVFDEEYLVGISNIESLGVDLLSYAEPQMYGAFLRLSY
ncbi:TonB-dependent receptor [Ponticaulis profundi]|uniref:TonB-dependent receptor n=1 Tax=Ponticaulis profundi TaxID=2665222 RepID=A0ABW1S7M2_9PROT